MRKIISLLVALGMVLSMSVTAVPAAAFPPTDWGEVSNPRLSTSCEGAYATYNITFDLLADLHSGHDTITVKFPEGTIVPTTWKDGDIKVGLAGGPPAGKDVFGSEVVTNGQEVTLTIPESIVGVTTGDRVWVFFGTRTGPPRHGIQNPAACAYCYHVEVKTSRGPQNWFVKSGWDDDLDAYDGYSITPTRASYKFYVDFADEYPGIAFNYFPPLKQCNTYDFDIVLWRSTGCAGYEDVQKSIRLISAPSKTATLNITIDDPEQTDPIELTLERPVADYDENWTDWALWGDDWDISGGYYNAWNATVHVDTVGAWEFCIELYYPGDEDPECPREPITWKSCYEFDGKQWMDTAAFDLEPKWNLISLPIVPFDTSTSAILAPLANKFARLSTWHYDRCLDDWFVSGNGQTSLTDIEDGKAYWFRMMLEHEHMAFFKGSFGESFTGLLWSLDASTVQPYLSALYASYGYPPLFGDIVGRLYRAYVGPPWTVWVFGTEKPMPPSGPASYPVCEGWNMVGFTSIAPDSDANYLWNFYDLFGVNPLWGFVYSWDVTNQTWDPPQTPGLATLNPGLGYWIPFAKAGTIQP